MAWEILAFLDSFICVGTSFPTQGEGFATYGQSLLN